MMMMMMMIIAFIEMVYLHHKQLKIQCGEERMITGKFPRFFSVYSVGMYASKAQHTRVKFWRLIRCPGEHIHLLTFAP